MNALHNFQYYIFDFDGTVAQSLDWWIDYCQQELRLHGQQLTWTEIKDALLKIKRQGEIDFGITDYDRFYTRVYEQLYASVGNIVANPEFVATVQGLKKQGKRMAVVTSSLNHFVSTWLEHHGLQKTFDSLWGYDDVTAPKPDPEGIYKALRLWDADSSEAIMIGDSHIDIQTGKNAQIATLLYYPQEHRQYYTEEFLFQFQPDFQIEQFSELLSI